MHKQREQLSVLQFLAGMKSELEPVRAQILSGVTLPTVAEAYSPESSAPSLLIQRAEVHPLLQPYWSPLLMFLESRLMEVVELLMAVVVVVVALVDVMVVGDDLNVLIVENSGTLRRDVGT